MCAQNSRPIEMGHVIAMTQASRLRSRSSQVLICVGVPSPDFLRSHSMFPEGVPILAFEKSEGVLERLWHDPDRVATVVLDHCPFDFEDLLYASLNHTHVCSVIRSPELVHGMWRRRYARRPNMKLPCAASMLWTHVLSSPLIESTSAPV